MHLSIIQDNFKSFFNKFSGRGQDGLEGVTGKQGWGEEERRKHCHIIITNYQWKMRSKVQRLLNVVFFQSKSAYWP